MTTPDELEADWVKDRRFLAAESQPGIVAMAQKWHSAYRKAQNSNLVRAQEIEKQAARIQELETSLAEAERLIRKNADMINAQTGMVATLREIAIEERQNRITPPLCNCRSCTSGSDFVEKRKRFHEKQKEIARDQLAKEHPEAFR